MPLGSASQVCPRTIPIQSAMLSIVGHIVFRRLCCRSYRLQYSVVDCVVFNLLCCLSYRLQSSMLSDVSYSVFYVIDCLSYRLRSSLLWIVSHILGLFSYFPVIYCARVVTGASIAVGEDRRAPNAPSSQRYYP